MSNRYFLQVGNEVQIQSGDSMTVTDHLVPSTYTMKYNSQTEKCFLVKSPVLTTVPKVYGDLHKRRDRIINTYHDRTTKLAKNTGVLLTGEKGSGKTLLVKEVSNALLKDNIPTIIINTAYPGEAIRDILSSITSQCLIVFDEFEKTFWDNEDQEEILTVLDGLTDSNSLFLFTCNNPKELSDCLIDRPGRIFYVFNYDEIDIEFVKEYAADNLINKDHLESILDEVESRKFNFDQLQSLVEEMNRYNEDAHEAIEYLNIFDRRTKRTQYLISFIDEKGNEVSPPEELNEHPLQYLEEIDDFYRGVYDSKTGENVTIHFNKRDLINSAKDGSEYLYAATRAGERITVKFTKQNEKQLDTKRSNIRGSNRPSVARGLKFR